MGLIQEYPGGVYKQLLDEARAKGAGTEPALDQYTAGGPVKQVVDYADPVVTEPTPTLSQYAPGGPLEQIDEWIATAGGGGGDNTLTLNGMVLQLNGQDLTLGA